MFESYIDVRDWLENFIPQVWTKQELGLERIKYLLQILGRPQDEFKSIHVAGTSGKGSTVFYIARLLELAGPVSSFLPASARSRKDSLGVQQDDVNLRAVGSPSRTATRKQIRGTPKIGLHLSPHLVDIRERMVILPSGHSERSEESKVRSFAIAQDDKKGQGNELPLMPMRRFLRLFNQIKPAVEKIKATKPDLTPSYFEILVAASFRYFAEEKVDFAVVEVGLGGRLDATNVLSPVLTLITNIGLDHTEILGTTVEKIAYEKAGIIKENVPVVTGALRLRSGLRLRGRSDSRRSSTTEKALKVIEKVAKEKKAPLIKINTRLRAKPPKSDTKNYLIKYYDIVRHITQNFVLENVLLAIAALETLGFRVSKPSLKKVLSLPFPGRFEQIDDRLIIDGAHNPDKIRALIEWIKNSFFDINGVVLVVAFKKGKQWKKMIDLLIKNLPVKKVIATKFFAVTDTGRFGALDPELIKNYISEKYSVECSVVANSQQAAFSALDASILGTSQLILVTGSLYLVGEARTVWKLPKF